MEPFKLTPAFKDYIWGGEKLKKFYNKRTNLEIVAESWELSSHKDGSSIIGEVAGGADIALLGTSFLEFTQKYPEAVGTRAKGSEFPILIKLIDAKNDLSIQVHPNDAYAKIYENSPGKTELWHILEAEESAFLYIGYNKNMEKDEVAKLIQNGGIIDALNKIPVKRGDTFLINAGTLHAINKGIVLAEIQQSSNLTYRVYDYGRKGPDGNPRELHIEKALAVMTTEKYTSEAEAKEAVNAEEYFGEGRLLAKCEYFTVYANRLEQSGEGLYNGTEDTFAALLVTEGALKVISENSELSAQKGDCVFIPAGKKTIKLTGNAEYLTASY